MTSKRESTVTRVRLYAGVNILLFALLLLIFAISLATSSTDVSHLTKSPVTDAVKVLFHRLFGTPETTDSMKTYSMLVNDIRLPRVITAAFIGAALAVSGCAMQGLLMNPLADGSILGISAGGTLGAVAFIAFGAALPPALAGGGVAVVSILFSFLSLLIVLSLAWRFDKGFVTNTIILIGIVFSMLASSVTSLIIAFSGNKIDHLIHWMMGSLSASKYANLVWLIPVCVAGILFLMAKAPELNAFALGEEQAGYLGVNTRAAKLQIMIVVSALIGVSVSVSGMIGFVGLIPPHIIRLFTGSNHKRLIPSTALFGASFLMLADLISRTAVRPIEIPIGVVTSLAGSVLFLYLFNSMRGKKA